MFCFKQLDKWRSSKSKEHPPNFGGVLRHSEYRMIEVILRQRFPSHADDPLCATVTICLLADDVCDIRELIAVICSSNSVTEKDAREALYRIAALFLHMERHNRLPYRLRYQIHHALYLSEKTHESGINFTA